MTWSASNLKRIAPTSFEASNAKLALASEASADQAVVYSTVRSFGGSSPSSANTPAVTQHVGHVETIAQAAGFSSRSMPGSLVPPVELPEPPVLLLPPVLPEPPLPFPPVPLPVGPFFIRSITSGPWPFRSAAVQPPDSGTPRFLKTQVLSVQPSNFQAAQLIIASSSQACQVRASASQTSPSRPPSASVAPHSLTNSGSPAS